MIVKALSILLFLLSGSHACSMYASSFLVHCMLETELAMQDTSSAMALRAVAIGVAVGLLALGESLPTTQAGRNSRLLAWILIAVGVAMLANGQGRQ